MQLTGQTANHTDIASLLKPAFRMTMISETKADMKTD